MKRKLSILITLLVLLLTTLTVSAQSGDGFDLSWSTIDGGGGTSIGGNYSLSGTVGQADAGVQSGGGYTLAGGFWDRSGATHEVYLPLVLK